jgi:hypothetical protein
VLVSVAPLQLAVHRRRMGLVLALCSLLLAALAATWLSERPSALADEGHRPSLAVAPPTGPPPGGPTPVPGSDYCHLPDVPDP